MTTDPPDQLSLFSPDSASSGARRRIRPWRASVADTWKGNKIRLEELERLSFDLLRRDREFLKALACAKVDLEGPPVSRFQERDFEILANTAVARGGEIEESDALELARFATESAKELASTRLEILRDLDRERFDRVQAAESRVRVGDLEIWNEIARVELEIAIRTGKYVEFELPVDSEGESPFGLLGIADVDAMVDRYQTMMTTDQENRTLPPRMKLRTLLKGLPVVWLDAVATALDVAPARGRAAREASIARCLLDDSRLGEVVHTKLRSEERRLLSFLLKQEEAFSAEDLTSRFSSDESDGWFWNETAPTSIVGRARLHGLVFVGTVAETGRAAVIPRELRSPLRSLLL